MDKSWMFCKNRWTKTYLDGVKTFIDQAKRHLRVDGKCRCPCVSCVNNIFQHISIVERHIKVKGFCTNYVCWKYHGEVTVRSNSEPRDAEQVHDDVINSATNEESVNYNEAEILNALNDACPQQIPSSSNGDENYNIADLNEIQYPNLAHLFAEAKKELYTGSKVSALNFIVTLLHTKVLNKWSNNSFDMLLKGLRAAFPDGAKLPESYYDAKRMLRDLGLGYETYDVCINDCVLYYKDKKDLLECPVCHEKMYKNDGTKVKNVPHKKMHYFPVIPRLRRLFMSRYTAKDMRWHKEARIETEGVLRHPADAEEWKDFDKKFPEFANDPRNVRLGLCTDGFNPFGDLSNSYSMWPVFLVPYNMPSWRCMKQEFMMLSVLIPGKRYPGQDIDTFLRPLIEDLKELWNPGVRAFDVVDGNDFNLRAMVIWTINDFPAYGTLSGYSTQGKKACPVCMDELASLRVRSKTIYVGHRRYLCSEHAWRLDIEFDGTIERRVPPRLFTGDELIAEVNKLWVSPTGKHANVLAEDKRRRKDAGYSNDTNWKRKCILWELEYWPKLKLRHVLDVMHIEKNVCESLLFTLLGVDGKSKDTDKAREDLKDLKIRKELHIKTIGNKIVKPAACYTLTPSQRKTFCEFLKGVKFPDGYAANISRNVNVKDSKLMGFKSHDYHVLMQRILPIGIWPYLKKKVFIPIFEISSFFQQICARTLSMRDLDSLQEGIIFTLCKLERIFPPAFFDIMIHLIIHLPHEAKLVGPVHTRWMYPFERALGNLKKYVKNKARPEGSIAEGYIINEALTYCSMYLSEVETRFNRLERNPDYVEPQSSKISIFRQLARPFGASTSVSMSPSQRDQLHWYILNNTPELEEYVEEHAKLLEIQGVGDIPHAQATEFLKWFKQTVRERRANFSQTLSDDLYSISNTPNLNIQSYPGCMVNGVRYHSKLRDERRTTQNHGICVEAELNGDSSDFYGVIDEIWEVPFMFQNKVIVFKCSWFDTSNGHDRLKTEFNFTSIKVDLLWFEDEPYALADQVRQVFYVDNHKEDGTWKICQKVNHRHIWENAQEAAMVDSEIDLEDVDNNAYQESLSSEVNVTFDVANVETAPLNRTDIGPIEIQGIYIDLGIGPSNTMQIDESEEENEYECEEIDSDEEFTDSDDY